VPHHPLKVKAFVILGILILLGLSIRFYLQRGSDGLVLFGNVDIREVAMAFRQGGRVQAMYFEEGANVEAGTLLAQLDQEPFRESLDQAEADFREAAANYDKLKNGFRKQEIAQAEELVRQIEASLRYADSELGRQHQAVGSGATTRQTLDQASTSKESTQAQLLSARQELSLKREGSRREDIVAAAAHLDSARARLAFAQTAFEDTRLLAPQGAIIQSKILEPGSMVSPSSPIYTLSLKDPVYVRAYLSESQLGKAIPGTKVSVTHDSSPKVYHGTIGFVSPKAEFTPKTVETTDLRTDLVYRVRITVTDPDEGLRQGMPVTIQTTANTLE
jgi:HlyD family secretion protein